MAIFSKSVFSMQLQMLRNKFREISSLIKNERFSSNLLKFLDDANLDNYGDAFKHIWDNGINNITFCLELECILKYLKLESIRLQLIDLEHENRLKIYFLTNLFRYHRNLLKKTLAVNCSPEQFKSELDKISKSILLSNDILDKMPLENIKIYEEFLVFISKSLSSEFREELGYKFVSNVKLNIYSYLGIDDEASQRKSDLFEALESLSRAAIEINQLVQKHRNRLEQKDD